MKTRYKLLTTLLAIFIYTSLIPELVSAQRGNVSIQIFYDQLSPYGQWANNNDYGYVWIPDVGPDFSPYSTNGYWVMTDYGWTWVSDFDWGWAPFHYGRWDYDNYYGWYWVPDTEWGPSWVTWRRGNGYYGWAPMRPGISINMSFGTGYNGYNDINRWNFVRDRDFGRPDLGRYYINRRDNDMIIRNSTVINNTYVDNSRNVTYIVGPRRDDVQKVTGRRISSVRIRDYDKPGENLNNGRLNIYRPRVERNIDARQRPAPSRLINPKDIRPPAERNINNRQNNVQQQQQTESRRQDQQQRQRQLEQQNQQNDTRREDQQQQQQRQLEQKQQTDTRREDQHQQQQRQLEQKQQTDTRRQDQQQQQQRQLEQQNQQNDARRQDQQQQQQRQLEQQNQQNDARRQDQQQQQQRQLEQQQQTDTRRQVQQQQTETRRQLQEQQKQEKQKQKELNNQERAKQKESQQNQKVNNQSGNRRNNR